MLKALITLFLLLLAVASHAFTVKPLKDNATINVSISSKSLNRIFVTTDRIVETYGIDGSFRIEKDEDQGSIFIIPLGYYKTHPFDLFIKTEHSHNYTLHLIPNDIESKTIAIKPLSPVKDEAKRWEMSSPYENVLVDLIKGMEIGKTPPGYVSIPLGDNQPTQRQSQLSFQLNMIYRGDHLEGQIWLVKNIGQKEIYLHPKYLHGGKILAASFDKKVLQPNEVAKLYWVKSYAA